jgi:hypothetical protein
MRDLSEPIRSGKNYRRSSENLEWWTNRTQEDGNRQLLEQSQKAPMNKSVIISEETHKLLKEYCQIEGIKTQHLADRIIREWLEKKKEAK